MLSVVLRWCLLLTQHLQNKRTLKWNSRVISFKKTPKPRNSDTDVMMKTESLAFNHPINVYGKKENFYVFS